MKEDSRVCAQYLSHISHHLDAVKCVDFNMLKRTVITKLCSPCGGVAVAGSSRPKRTFRQLQPPAISMRAQVDLQIYFRNPVLSVDCTVQPLTFAAVQRAEKIHEELPQHMYTRRLCPT